MKPMYILMVACLGIGFLSCFSRHAEDRNTDFTDEYSENHDSASGEETTYDEDSGCNIDNGTYSATVEYYNPGTDYSSTYTLDVEVENCQVTIIYFLNGGWLDDSHIDPTDLDESGYASIEDDRGRTFEIQID